MLALALVLLALVVVLVVASFVGSSEEVVIEFLNITITTSVGGVFLSGVVAGLIALASIFALRISLRRRSGRRKEVEELRRRAELAGPATKPDDRSEAAARPGNSEPAAESPDRPARTADGTDELRREPGSADETSSEPPAEDTGRSAADARRDPEAPRS